MYLNNPYTPKLHTAYYNFISNVTKLSHNKIGSMLVLMKQPENFKDLPAEITDRVNSIDDIGIDTTTKDLHSKCTNNIKSIRHLTGKYFS